LEYKDKKTNRENKMLQAPQTDFADQWFAKLIWFLVCESEGS
jgi:hypothetical protein